MKIIKPALLTLIFAIILAVTEHQSRDVIAANEIRYEERILREMTGGAMVTSVGDAYEARVGDELIGHIRTYSTNRGYNGEIRLLVATTPGKDVIQVRVIAHNETPGLGDKIDKSVSDWVDGFNGASADSHRWAIKPEGDFDGITGATITASAVIETVREATQ